MDGLGQIQVQAYPDKLGILRLRSGQAMTSEPIGSTTIGEEVYRGHRSDYNDGASNEYQTWTYDAAGNRASDYTGSGWTYDNLNRMTASPGVTYTNDAVGNRTGKSGGVSYTWDDVNRMTSLTASSTTWNYRYRADGMRVSKKRGSGGDLDTDYRYDGQMLVEESFSGTSYPRDYVQVIRYGLGARGIDFIERVRQQSGTVQGYPIYDGHGNMVATLSKNGNGFLVSDRRAYDAWGNVRKGNTMGEPNGRYCANLGHVQDDESGLVYMRARYYEPWTGRFVSEDQERQGHNWTVYCANNPVSMSDASGKSFTDDVMALMFNLAIAATITALAFACVGGAAGIFYSITASAIAVVAWGLYFGAKASNPISSMIDVFMVQPIMKAYISWAASAAVGLNVASKTLAFAAVAGSFAYAVACWGVLMGIDFLDSLAG